jgi:glycine betaine/proline transport system substrate-binding protein
MIAAAGLALTASQAFAVGKGTIKIGEGDWTGNLVDVHLAKIILEEHVGYDVELIFADYTGQWIGLANGDLDVAMEIWPSISTAAHEEWIDQKKQVEVLGELGVVATAGWYVPTYVIKGDPARGIEPMAPDLVSYRELNKYAELFARPETGGKGFCLDSVPTWELHNEDRIASLGLNYVNVFAGTEGALMAELDGAYTKGEPLLMCNIWTPHWAVVKFDLTEIELPPYTDECFESGRYDCDYAEDRLYNISRAGFKEDFPEAYAFFQKLNLSSEAQQQMLLDVDVNKLSVEDAVRKWMAANEDTWRPWLP